MHKYMIINIVHKQTLTSTTEIQVTLVNHMHFSSHFIFCLVVGHKGKKKTRYEKKKFFKSFTL